MPKAKNWDPYRIINLNHRKWEYFPQWSALHSLRRCVGYDDRMGIRMGMRKGMGMRMRHASVIHWTNKARHVASTMKRIKVDYNMKLDLSGKMGRWKLQVESGSFAFELPLWAYTRHQAAATTTLPTTTITLTAAFQAKNRTFNSILKGEKTFQNLLLKSFV